MTLDEFIDENAAPDGVAVLADGGIGKVKDVDRSADVQGNLLLADRGLNTIRESAGVTGENRGLETDAKSRSEEHTSELQSLMSISYAVFCLKKKKTLVKSIKQRWRTTQREKNRR